MAVGIVDLLDRLGDPVDRALGKLDGEAGASPRCETGNAVEHSIHLGRPAARLMIIDKVPRACRALDQLRRRAPRVLSSSCIVAAAASSLRNKAGSRSTNSMTISTRASTPFSFR
jgi:hypothetical protein